MLFFGQIDECLLARDGIITYSTPNVFRDKKYSKMFFVKETLSKHMFISNFSFNVQYWRA